jgi:lipopolysaccharide export system permease protein
VASPIIQVASLVAVVILALNLWVQPLCFRELRAILDAVRGDLAATMVTPGQFTHPTGGLTVYAQSIDKQGVIHNLFIDAAGPKGTASTVMANEARFAKRDGAPVLILHSGSYQQVSKRGDLNLLQFDEYPIDLRPFLAIRGQVHYRESDSYLHELLFPDTRAPVSPSDRRSMLAEANARLATPLYSLAFTSLSLAAVLGGAFSRLGYGARIAAAAGAGVVVRVVGFVAGAVSASDPRLNLLQYAAPTLCFAVSMIIVLRQHPVRGGSRPVDTPTAQAGSAA